MTHIQTKIFKSNKSQAVRLPKAVAFPEAIQEVKITSIGNKRVITPVGQSWDDWFAASGVSDDFMEDRQQPEDQIPEDQIREDQIREPM